MKFNWRANWEILLVLVIIVVGIVITTIAAIRNKDKHLLPLTEETDYGQLLAGGAAAGSFSDAGGGNQQQQQQQHYHHLQHQQTTEAQSQNTSPSADPPQQQVQAAVKTQQVRHTTQGPFRPIVRDTHSSSNNHRDYHQSHQANHHEVRQRPPTLTKYDDGAEFSRAPAPGQINPLTGNDQTQMVVANGGLARFNMLSNDHYEPASTEPSLTQVRPEQVTGLSGAGYSSPAGNVSQQLSHGFAAMGYQPAGSRRHINRTQPGENELQLNYGDTLSDQADLMDDIHTTRSSLAGDSGTGSPQKTAASMGGNQQAPDLGSTLSMQAPYGAPSINANSMNQLGQLLMQTAMNGNKPDHEGTILNPEDVLYGRAPLNANLTEALLNEYSMAALGTSNLNSSQQQQLMSSTMLANLLSSLPTISSDATTAMDPFGQTQTSPMPTPPSTTPAPGSHRPFASLTPFSLLLNDLLKIARPHQQQQQQQNEANSNRPQGVGSILQHSRLPGPLLSLLQGGGSSNGLALGSNHLPGDSTQNYHDASESSQHYQRVSMSPTDIQSILAHSLIGSAVLPAFPPPKGAPQNWIPPTSGGNSDYNSAQNSNADFVINNVAGFLRSSQADATSLPTTNQYDSSYQRQTLGNQQQVGSFFAPADVTQAQQQQQQQQQQQLVAQQPQQQQQSDQVKIDQQQHSLAHIGSNQSPGSAPALWTQSAVSSGGRQVSGGDPDRKVFRSTLVGQNNALHGQHQTANFANYQQQVHSASQNGKVASFNSGGGSSSGGNNNMNVISSQQYQSPSSPLTSAGPVYSPRLPSEIPVPLGYSPPSQPQQQQQQPQQQVGSAANVHADHNLRQTLVSAGNHKQQQPQQQQAQSQLINKVGTVAPNRLQTQNAQPKRRRKRSAGSKKVEEKDRVDEVMSSRYGASDDDDDDTDSRPISVVRPDGRPMNSGRVRGFSIAAGKSAIGQLSAAGSGSEPAASDRQVAQSQRSANHLGLKRHSDHHHKPSGANHHHQNRANEDRGEEVEGPAGGHRGYLNLEPNANSIEARQKCKHNSGGGRHKGAALLDTAGSGLMSKLLGTASTTDELEEELDDDEDPASEKRKEEIEDAEFGMVNDDRQRGAPESNSEGDSSQADNGGGGGGKMRSDSDTGLGSGSTDNESYMRRNQQRSDIEFYGHPGEETRQLKYGILGSGNYEVVNGGIYPEADESTAAVNSVANYVRKPGQSSLLSALPKLLGAGGSSEPVSPQSAFMPGGRVGGFMRGASEQPNRDELAGLVPAEEAAAKDALNSPLLELIEANGGQLFDPSLLAQLGSSGSSARSMHTSQDSAGGSQKQSRQRSQSKMNHLENPDENSPERLPSSKSHQPNGPAKFRNSLQEELEKNYDHSNHQDSSAAKPHNRANKLDSNDIKSRTMDRQQSSISGSRSQGTNQFNSYQLLPSKKVTIFSDQDLDSAPSEMRRWQWPSHRQYQPFV